MKKIDRTLGQIGAKRRSLSIQVRLHLSHDDLRVVHFQNVDDISGQHLA